MKVKKQDTKLFIMSIVFCIVIKTEREDRKNQHRLRWGVIIMFKGFYSFSVFKKLFAFFIYF